MSFTKENAKKWGSKGGVVSAKRAGKKEMKRRSKLALEKRWGTKK